MKRNLILPLILIALASQQLTAETPRSVAQSSPEGLVSDLYKLDEKKQRPFSQTKDHGLVAKYFSGPLAQLIGNEAVKSRGEVGGLEAGARYGAQDLDIEQFSLRKAKGKKESAAGIASFEQ